MRASLILSCLLAGVSLSTSALAGSGGSPVVLSHSGYVLGASDGPVDEAAQAMAFRVFTGASGGAAQWTATCPVAIRGGYYAVELGGGACAGDGLDTADFAADGQGFLEISVGDTVLSPRHAIAPSVVIARDALRLGGVVASEYLRRSETGVFLTPSAAAASFQPIGSYLTAESAATQFLSQATAQTIYLTKSDALATYAPIGSGGVGSGGSASAFTTVTGAAANTFFTSNAVPFGGSGGPAVLFGDATATIVKNGVDTGQRAETFLATDTIAIRMRSATQLNASVGATVTLGGSSAAWVVKTEATCTPFTFAAAQAPFDTDATTGTVILAGFASTLLATISGDPSAVLLHNGSPVTSATVLAGDSLAVRLRAAATVGVVRSATVTVGNYVTTWTVTAADCASTRASCAAHLAGGCLSDGPYSVNPGGTTFTTWCDMNTDGGGWTLVASVVTQSPFWATATYSVSSGARTVTLGSPTPTSNYVLALPRWRDLMVQSGSANRIRVRVRQTNGTESTIGQLQGLVMNTSGAFTSNPTAVYNSSGTNVGTGACVIQYTSTISDGLAYANFNSGDPSCTGHLGWNGSCGYTSLGHNGDYVGSGTTNFTHPCTLTATYSPTVYARKWYWIR